VEKYFGPIPRGAPVTQPAVVTQPVTAQRRETLTDDVQLSRIFLGVIGPSAWSDEAFAFDILQEVLTGGKTSRLYKALVYDKQVAQDVDMLVDRATYGSAAEIRVTVKPGHLPAEAEALLNAEIERIQQTPPTAVELQRAQRNVETRLYRALERLNGNGSRADLLNAFQLWRGDPGFVNQVVGRWRAVTARAVQDSARKFLGGDQRVVLTVNPAPRTASAAQ
jgi:zinc protease